VFGQIVRGNVAHLLVEVPDIDEYALVDPKETPVDLQQSKSRYGAPHVVFEAVTLAAGTWSILLGTTVQTTFEVISFNGSLVGLTSNQVVLMSVTQYDNIGTLGDYYLQLRHYSEVDHECVISGQNGSSDPTVVPLNTLKRIAFNSNYTVVTYPIDGTPAAGLTMYMQGVPQATPGVGNVLVFDAPMAIAPPGNSQAIYPQSLNAFAFFTSSYVVIEVQVRGTCDYLDPFPPHENTNAASTATLTVTITSGS
jgi:hypothetical protein